MNQENEVWKSVPGLGGHYEASSFGRIRAKARVVTKGNRSQTGTIQQIYAARILPGVDDNGYRKVHLSVDGKKMLIGVHVLVCSAFFGQGDPGSYCLHNDGDSFNNRPENLRWGTHADNMLDRKKHGHYGGEQHPMAKITADLVLKIRRGTITAAECGIGKSQFYRIKAGQAWKGVSST